MTVEKGKKTKWTTMAIRKGTMDNLNSLATYEHRTAGEMVAVMTRVYIEKLSAELTMSVDEVKTFLDNYVRD
tara:strand:+ start:3175 stop:3390 length:216 start_codon:yes stop_codon:yes gene_type:complete